MNDNSVADYGHRLVLDHGLVRLVDYMGGDISVSRGARVSYDAPPREEDGKLISYLMKNKHTTPFEQVDFIFEVKAPIFVFRQWHRHRTWSYNELSARYKELPEVFYLPTPELIGKQSASNKQMREMIEGMTDEEERAREEEIQWVQEHCQEAFLLYHKLIGRGWPRELARTVLPLATYSHMFAKSNLHNLLHFLRLRDHEHAQYEVRVYAQAMLELIEPIVPLCVKAFKETL